MLRDLHVITAWIAILANGIVGVWAVAAHWVRSLQHAALWWAIGAAQVLLFVQVILGVAQLSRIDGEPDQFHTFYGFLCLIAVAILYGYRSQVPHLRHLLYGGGSLFIMGLAIRAMFLDTGLLDTGLLDPGLLDPAGAVA